MRFVDSTRTAGLWVDEDSIYGGQRDSATRQKYDELMRDVAPSICFDIQSVADLLWDESISGWWGSSFAPPFERMVLEYASGGYMDRVAIFARVRDVVTGFSKPEHRRAAAEHWWRSVADGAWSEECPVFPFDQARWLVSLYLFTKGEGFKNFRAPIGRACFALDGDGRPLSDGGAGFVLDMWVSQLIVRHVHLVESAESHEGDDARRYDIAAESLQTSLIQPFLATMALLNTKNIETREVFPSRQQRRDAERREIDPPATYRVLTVAVPGVDRGSASKRNTTSLVNVPLHIVRGHIARYGPDFGKGKLFGKYDGQFWIPAHVRGTAEAGKVVKDYSVKAPKEQAA